MVYQGFLTCFLRFSRFFLRFTRFSSRFGVLYGFSLIYILVFLLGGFNVFSCVYVFAPGLSRVFLDMDVFVLSRASWCDFCRWVFYGIFFLPWVFYNMGVLYGSSTLFLVSFFLWYFQGKRPLKTS